MRNTFNFLLALLNFMDSCFLLGMILEVLRNNFRMDTNFHRLLFPYFLYPFNSIALTFSIFMTISIAFERYDAMHNIAQHNQVRAKSHCYFIRLNPRKKGTFKFCLPALLGIHRNSKQKQNFRSSEGFLR